MKGNKRTFVDLMKTQPRLWGGQFAGENWGTELEEPSWGQNKYQHRPQKLFHPKSHNAAGLVSRGIYAQGQLKTIEQSASN